MQLRNFTYSLIKNVRQPDFTFKSGGFSFLLVLLCIVFQSQFLYAQVGVGTENELTQIISVKGDAKIYSADESFNQQIIQEQIRFNKLNVSYTNISEKEYLVIALKRNSKPNQNTLTTQIKHAEIKKASDLLKKVKKQISEYEARKESFVIDNLKNYPSTSHFSTTQIGNKDYIILSTDHQNFSKIYSDEKKYSVNQSLGFLHSQKFTYYNNKSLDCCYSLVYSVRPPPELLG